MRTYWKIGALQLGLFLCVGAIISGCSSGETVDARSITPIGAQVVPDLELVCGDIKTKAQLDMLSTEDQTRLMMQITLTQEAFAQRHGFSDEQRKQARKDRDSAIQKSEYREVLGYYLLPAQ